MTALLQITLTSQQQRDFTACAETCGLDLANWIVQCASVQAAAVIDALQAPERAERKSRQIPRNNPRALAAEGPRADAVESSTLKAARAYNTQFRSRAKER
jgi:hypothetical protein